LTIERLKEPPHFWLLSPLQADVHAFDVLMLELRVVPHQHSFPYSVPDSG